MFRNRTAASVALVVMALIASTMSAGASPSRTSRPTTARQPSGTTQEYVVVFDQGTEAGTAAIQAAGGTVLDVNEEVGVALVNTTNDAFVADVSAESGVVGAAHNHAVGTSEPGMPHVFAKDRPEVIDRAAVGSSSASTAPSTAVARGAEPLSNLQWNMAMIGATKDGAHRRATGKGADIGIIDTGVDGTHPDLAPNFDSARSRNFTMDIPSVDGPCEEATCIDPSNVDDNGHGTHVAGISAADNNRFGVGGVAPDAKLVNLRAGQDSGFFFVYETVAALVEAGNLGLDVVNMSFFTDPWQFNCASTDDYVSGDVSPEEIAEQALIRQLVVAGVDFAHDHGVTLVAAAGNSHLDLAAPTRADAISPDFPPGSERERVVTSNCLDLPGEGPNVIQTSSVGPSTTKSDFSNYGSPNIEVAAPGGWFRDFVGTPAFQTQPNLVLSSYPLDVAIETGRADANGNPTDDRSVKYCNNRGVCGFYTRLQGTSMASPHAAGVAALIVSKHGHRVVNQGKELDPDTVGQILAATATDHACPAGGVEIYEDEGRPAEFNAPCAGTTAFNGLYGEGIVSAINAVQ